MPTKRTTHRSSSGKKLYAVRRADGTFKDSQTYERAHRADLAKKSKAETTYRLEATISLGGMLARDERSRGRVPDGISSPFCVDVRMVGTVKVVA